MVSDCGSHLTSIWILHFALRMQMLRVRTPLITVRQVRIAVVAIAVTVTPACSSLPWLDSVPDLPHAEAAVGHPLDLALGQIRSLDHPDFSQAAADSALWAPLAMLRKGSAGIFFQEPYDPQRIPVLFVPGVRGSPRNFRYMIETLDRSRFQVWLFNYPSGFRIESVATLLHDLLAELERKYRYDTLFITAHSAGGLVTQSYLKSNFSEGALVKLLVSFSTPWMGNSLAGVGSRNPLVTVPSWKDLTPDSDFLISLRKPTQTDFPLPPHYVFFGYRRDPSLLTTASSDSVISVASQVPPWIQDQSERYWGYDTTHIGILSNALVLRRYKALLESAANCLRWKRSQKLKRAARKAVNRREPTSRNHSDGDSDSPCKSENCTAASPSFSLQTCCDL